MHFQRTHSYFQKPLLVIKLKEHYLNFQQITWKIPWKKSLFFHWNFSEQLLQSATCIYLTQAAGRAHYFKLILRISFLLGRSINCQNFKNPNFPHWSISKNVWNFLVFSIFRKNYGADVHRIEAATWSVL